MKFRSMSLLLVLSMAAMMFYACEAAVDGDQDTDVAEPTDTVGEPDVVVEEAYGWIRIADDPTNSTLASCTNKNPGADIDAVALYRGGLLIGWAGKVIGTNLGDICSTNTASDPNQALGIADETDPMDTDNLFVSLNGGEIVVRIDDEETGEPILIQKGDEIWVYEVEGTTEEFYYVDLCDDQNCTNALEIGHGTGLGKFVY